MADTGQSSEQSLSLLCSICNNKFNRPHLLPCLHVFCFSCLQDECQGNSPDKFFCPLCVTTDDKDRKSTNARPWHSFERIAEKETENEELQKRLSELPAFEDKGSGQVVDSDDSSGGSGSNPSASRRMSTYLEPPSLFPCTMHTDRLADTFCVKCNQLACPKCVSSFHRRCQSFSDLQTAVETKRNEFDQIHSKMASNLVACDEVKSHQSNRITELEDMRTNILIDIKTYRTDLVNLVLAKEKALTLQANRMVDQMKLEATTKNNLVSRMSESLHKQMEFLDLSLFVKGEGELLPLYPGIMSAVEKDAALIVKQHSEDIKEVVFLRDEKCKEALTNSSLGLVSIARTQNSSDPTAENQYGACRDLNLVLATSFHGGTRDDVTEPLLTDLILLANGDVIVTDRDNKCVKKFNQTGKLLTRVIIDAVPSRIASVSHARAVVSVMTKKCLYFLSLFGTVRVLNSVPVKKIYSFLTSIGNGLLIAGTNQCDSIDLISERGETLKKIFTQLPDRATIARPLYLTPVVPNSSISLKLDHHSISNPKASNHSTVDTVNNNVHKSNSNTKALPTSDKNTHHNGGSNSNSNVLPQIIGKGGAHTSHSSGTHAIPKANRRKSLLATKHNSSSSPSNNQMSSSTTSTSSLSSKLALNPSSQSNINKDASSSRSNSNSPSPEIDLLVSDSGKRVMFRLQQNGEVAFKFKSSEHVPLECPLGVTVHDTGLTLLSDRDSDCILLLDEAGRYMKKLLTCADGISKPCGIYAGNKGMVAMSQVDGMVKIYKPARR